jgi:hypothetical protein
MAFSTTDYEAQSWLDKVTASTARIEETADLFYLTQQFDQHMALLGNDEEARASFLEWFAEIYELDFQDEQVVFMFSENSEFWGRA